MQLLCTRVPWVHHGGKNLIFGSVVIVLCCYVHIHTTIFYARNRRKREKTAKIVIATIANANTAIATYTYIRLNQKATNKAHQRNNTEKFKLGEIFLPAAWKTQHTHLLHQPSTINKNIFYFLPQVFSEFICDVILWLNGMVRCQKEEITKKNHLYIAQRTYTHWTIQAYTHKTKQPTIKSIVHNKVSKNIGKTTAFMQTSACSHYLPLFSSSNIITIPNGKTHRYTPYTIYNTIR